MTVYSIREVNLNGNKVLKRQVRETEQEYEPTTTEEKQDRRNEMNARGTLLMALPNKDQLNTNEADNTAYGVSATHTQGNAVNFTSVDNLSDAVIYAFLVSQPNSPQLAREDLEQIDPDDLEEMDLHWEMAMLTIRARRMYELQGIREQRKVEKNGLKRTVTVETPTKNALIAQDGIGGYDWSYQAEEEHPTNFPLMPYTSSGSSSNSDSENNLLKSQVSDKFKTRLGYNAASSTAASPAVESFVNSSKMLENHKYNKSKSDKGYHAVPPPYTWNFILSKPDLMFMDEIVESENVDVITVITPSDVKKVETNHESADIKNKGDAVEPKTVSKNSFRSPIIEDLNSDDDSDIECIPNVKTGNPQQKEYREKGVFDSGCSRHMTGNKCYLTEYEDYDGGFVSFGDGKGRISENGNSWVSIPQTAQENGTLVTKMYVHVTAEENTNKKNDNTHVVVYMNKPEVDTMSIDDLYYNFKIVEKKVKKSFGASSGAQNLAFMTAPSTSSTNDVNTASPQVRLRANSFKDDWGKHGIVGGTLSLLSIRAKRYYQRTGKKIFINVNDIVGYDESKVECYFNLYRWDSVARDSCRALKKQRRLRAATYKRGLATVEEQLITYRKNEVLFSEEVAVLKREVACKDYEINVLKSEFEKVKQEKEGIEFKIEKFDKASKDLDKLLGSQITDKSKKGLGYNVVPPPHPLIYNRPKKLDLSYSGLDEFKDPEFKSYGSEDSKQESNIVCDKKSDDSKENSDDSLVKEQVSEDTSSFVESLLNVDKETVFLVDKKIEFVKPKNHEKLVKKSVRVNYNYTTNKTLPNAQRNMVPRAVLMKTSIKPFNTAKTVNTAHPKSTVFSGKPMSHFSKSAQSTIKRLYQSKTVLTNKKFTQKNNTAKAKAVNTARPKAVNTARLHLAVVNAVSVNQANFVKASAYWVWRPTKLDSASITLKKHNYIDARGRSKSVMAWVPKGN
ncbi:hypothetical protein Tco_0904672 [Tanacetum coccineum]